MKWNYYPLKKVAPSVTTKTKFSANDHVWHLNLDQIESHTGNIIEKKIAPASSAENSTYIFDTTNVLYSKLRPYLNKVVCPDEPGIATTELVYLCPHPQLLERKFLTYFLRSNHFLNFASMVVTGAKMPRVIMAKFWNYEIPLPPLTEQRQIVEILTQADRLRKLRANADVKSKRIIPAYFNEMFGDPATNPMGWKTGKLENVIDETQYGTSKKANSNGKGIIVLRMNNIDYDGHLDLANIKHVVLSEREQKKYALAEGDILFNRTNSKELVGKIGLWRSEIPAVIASYLIRVRLNNKVAIPEFIWAYMNCPFIKQVLLNKSRRAIGMANINAKELRDIPLILPGIKKQKIFAEKYVHIKKFREQRRESNDTLLNQLFNTLLYHAFTGNLTSSWREAHMKELLQEMELQAKALAS